MIHLKCGLPAKTKYQLAGLVWFCCCCFFVEMNVAVTHLPGQKALVQNIREAGETAESIRKPKEL